MTTPRLRRRSPRQQSAPGGRGRCRSLLAAAIAVALAACGGADSDPDPEPSTSTPELGPGRTSTLVHLDPRLAGGMSPADALAGIREVVSEWRFEAGAEDLGPWRLAGYTPPRRRTGGGLALRPVSSTSGRPSIVFEGSADAGTFNVIEVDVAIENDMQARFVWKHGPSPQRRVYVAERLANAETGRHTLVYSMPGGGAWEGPVDQLHFEQAMPRPFAIELHAIRFVRVGFDLGQSPTGPRGGDGGLVMIGDEALRAWPMPIDDPLVCEARVPEGGRLAFSSAIPVGDVPNALELTVAVRPVEAAREAREVVATRRWDRGTEDRGAWLPSSVDLGRFAGTDLHFEFEVNAPEGGGAALEARSVALLGAPVLVGAPPAEPPPNVLLVTIDTTRFDALGSALTGRENDLARTPFLAELGAESLVFTQAWSAANSTQPSHASIITGLAVQDHALRDNFGVLAPEATTLAELLRDAGYYTAGVVALQSIGPSSGFGQGFDRMAPPGPISHLDGRDRIDIARRWIAEWSEQGDRPFFLWVHLFDPHTPYRPSDETIAAYTAGGAVEPPPQRIDPPTLFEVDDYLPDVSFLRGINNLRYPRFLYHAEVHYADALLRDLYDALDTAGVEDRTLSIITADHGESLGERDVFFVHTTLTAETLHIPLLVRPPGGVEGRFVDHRVTNRDVVPTVVSQLGIDDVPPHRDLIAVAESGGDDQRVFWFEQANGFQVGCRDERYHFVTTVRPGFTLGLQVVQENGRRTLRRIPVPEGSTSLYDHVADPELQNDLSEERPEVVEAYLARLEAYRASAMPFERLAREVSEEQEAQLRELGYTRD